MRVLFPPATAAAAALVVIALPVLRRLHRWVAIVVALQMLAWCISGTVFAWLDHRDVSGEALLRSPSLPAVPAGTALADPRPWLAGMELHEVRLQPLLDTWVYRVDGPRGVRLLAAIDGSPVVVDEAVVRAAARTRYAGTGRIAAVARHEAGALEARDHGAAWSVSYDDDARTTLWFAADDARLLEARTNAWRVFDFFWMLHTMDYRGRDDFNHPLLVLFGSAALWVALTGVLLVVRVLRPKQAGAED